MVVCSPSVHLDENMHENPLEFNPSRWKVSIRILVRYFLQGSLVILSNL